MTLVTWLLQEIDTAEASTRELLYWAQQTILTLKDPKLLGKYIPGWHDWPKVEEACHQRLAELKSDRLILAEHAPEWQTVEWPHDQNGRGEAQVCRRCQNAEHTDWNPAVGQADVLPEGFVAPYVLAPCQTLRLLASPLAGRPGYRTEWRPA
ncbi:DUF6221 family protein [Micromonospora sp. NPDC006766]|uniref:DUF6221 family protein n=1 Tax=Micromonospora sp. NPDC006766 TaxID=3154778 RepID=UPI0033CDDF81